MSTKTATVKGKIGRKPASAMTTAEMEELGKRFDKPNVPTRPLRQKDRDDLARAAKRGRGRPKVGEGIERVLVTIEGGLLRQADAYCEAKGLKRAEMVAIGLRKVMAIK